MMEHTRGCGSPNKILQNKLLLNHDFQPLKLTQDAYASFNSALGHSNELSHNVN